MAEPLGPMQPEATDNVQGYQSGNIILLRNKAKRINSADAKSWYARVQGMDFAN